jgi:hypothetical protein
MVMKLKTIIKIHYQRENLYYHIDIIPDIT